MSVSKQPYTMCLCEVTVSEVMMNKNVFKGVIHCVRNLMEENLYMFIVLLCGSFGYHFMLTVDSSIFLMVI
jgi:hypothetical protein